MDHPLLLASLPQAEHSRSVCVPNTHEYELNEPLTLSKKSSVSAYLSRSESLFFLRERNSFKSCAIAYLVVRGVEAAGCTEGERSEALLDFCLNELFVPAQCI